MTGHRLEVADVFRQHEQEFLQQWGYLLSAHQLRAFRDICACRTAVLGAHLEQCDHCPHQAIAYNSCRNRHCPKCQSTARDKWLKARSAELLPVPYCHVVFTLPQELSTLALQNPRLIYGMLFRAVSETLLTIAADRRHLGAHIGFLAVLHTWNQKLMRHPHLHCVVPAGGLPGSFSLDAHPPPALLFARQSVGPVVPRKVSGLPWCCIPSEKAPLGWYADEVKEPSRVRSVPPSASSSVNWVVFAKRPFGGPEHVIKYLARYTHRVAIANGRLVEIQNGQVTFRWRDSADGNQQKSMTLAAVDFIRRYLLHILPPGFVKIRHFGFLANRSRREALLLCRSLLPMPVTAPSDSLTATQRRAVERTCPLCRIGTLHILDWIPAGTFFPPNEKPSVDSS